MTKKTVVATEGLPVFTVAKKDLKRKSNHPVNYNFTGVGELASLTINKNGKEKKPAKQLAEILKFAKDNKIEEMPRAKFLDVLGAVKEQTDENKAAYPQLCGSVQTMSAVVNHYWGVGQLQLAGVTGL